MNRSFNNFWDKTKITLNQAFSHAKETIYSITSTPSASVQQIADYIVSHPDSKISKKDYLGVTFIFYELTQEQMRYYLETKNTKILQLDVHSHQHNVISYRSYRDHHSLNTPLKFPNLHNAK